jgi:ElaB/YqjD/DUF883 family membrane-anchored ribosome-binding protein
MDRESPELIEREMEQTRESLTEKVALLENKVVGQIHSATDTVQETVESVQDTVQTVKTAVQDTVESVAGTVKDSVRSLADGLKETLDVRAQVQANPWAMVGGATVAGFVTGLVVFGRRPSARALPVYTPMPAASYAPAPAPPARQGWLNDLFDVALREVKTIAEQALTTATASFKQSVQKGIPKVIDSALPDVACRSGSDGSRRENAPAAGYGAGI